MQQLTIEYICKCQSTLTGIPVKLYKADQIVYKREAQPFNDCIGAAIFKLLKNNTAVISYNISESFNSYGLIKIANSDYSIFIGPSIYAKPTAAEIKKQLLLLNAELNLCASYEKYLSFIPPMHTNHFMLLLSWINLQVNNNLVKVRDLFNADETQRKAEYLETANTLFTHSEAIHFDEVEKNSTTVFEKKMLFFIKNGLTEQLINFMTNETHGKTGRLATNQIRQNKNESICSLTLSTRAAIAGGLSDEIAYQLSDIYIQKIESCTDIGQVLHTNYNALLDLCNRVRNLNNRSVELPIINKVIGYIIENTNQHLSVNDIAKRFKVNRGYLSTKFKETMSINLSEYITRQKIVEAQRLLKFSDKSLIDISIYLDFSSQSHLQTLFKKYVGQTPLEYRKMPNDEKIFI